MQGNDALAKPSVSLSNGSLEVFVHRNSVGMHKASTNNSIKLERSTSRESYSPQTRTPGYPERSVGCRISHKVNPSGVYVLGSSPKLIVIIVSIQSGYYYRAILVLRLISFLVLMEYDA